MEEHEKSDDREKYDRMQQNPPLSANDSTAAADNASNHDEKSSSRSDSLTTTLSEQESSTKRPVGNIDSMDLPTGEQECTSNFTNENPHISNKRLKTGASNDDFPKTPATTPISDDVENGSSDDGIAMRPPPTPPPSATSTATNASSVAYSEMTFASLGSTSAAASPYPGAPPPSGGGGWTDDDAYESMPKTPVAPPQASASRAAIRQNAMSPLPGVCSDYPPDVPPAPPTTPAPPRNGAGYRDLGLAAPLPFSAGFVQNANQLELQQRQHQQRKNEPKHEVHEGAATPAPHRDQHQAETTETATSTKFKTSSIPDDFSEWAVGDRYQLCRMLGRGSYGEVAQAIDKYQDRSDAYVAIKRIVGPFDQEVDAVRLFREIHILRRLRTLGKNDCIIPLLDVVQPPTDDLNDFHDLYLVFDYVDTDLYKLIMSPQYLTTEHIQTFLYQMLTGLKYIHSGNVIHRDLKPANILLNEDCSLKICDFGLARVVDEISVARSSSVSSSTIHKGIHGIDPNIAAQMKAAKRLAGRSCSISRESLTHDDDDDYDEGTTPSKMPLTRQLTKHVVTRWYRAPELILIQPYTTAVDVWSLGCIFAELLSMQEGSVPGYQDRTPLFPGGACYPLSGDADNAERLDQLNVIFNVIGTPSDEDVATLGKANEYLKTLRPIEPRNLKDIYPAADANALDLLNKMLKFNPNERCTAGEALNHVFFAGIRRKEMETSVEKPMESPAFLNAQEIDIDTLKKKAYNEVLWFRDNQNLKLSAQTTETETSAQAEHKTDVE